ncbi:uncharacterized protein N7503_003079 [Penicillium pulvis]|uniref:uncharacterized protein n=1 Tax=Penicillium pulvis TaxID=1562058 RepID=UPI0025467E4C|nr:uncharacterized protein N7503_003079 [Penicillium pulvis]KAJ5805477.1 hypothetical protein N7503_003079 [Penicillium pulvis]
MQFASYAILLASVCCTAFSNDVSFDEITKPSKGEVLQAGTMYNINWHSTVSGDVNLMLMGQKNSEYSTDALAVIGTTIDGALGHHTWNVTGGLSNNETYYIQIARVNDISTFSYSPGFKIHSNISASTTATSSPTATVYPSTTLSAMASGATNATESTSTSTGGSAVTSAPAPLAFIGVAAVGMLVF